MHVCTNFYQVDLKMWVTECYSPHVTCASQHVQVAVCFSLGRVIMCILFLLLFAVYDGPQSYDLNNPDSTTTRVQVLNVTPDASKTEDFSDSEDDDDDIPTINTGN